MSRVPFFLIAFTLSTSFAVAAPTVPVEHVDVYHVPGRFGGWPANHGIWSWGDEILVGFGAGYFKDNGPGLHAIDHAKAEEHLLARSLDGGQSWKIENPAADGALIPVGKALHGKTPPGLAERPWQDCPGGIDFTDPNFAMTLRMTDADIGPSRFYYSLDRGHAWRGPFGLSIVGEPKLQIAARTDYIVTGKHSCLLFLTAAKADGEEGRVFCAGTTDGGKTWKFISWIGAEPAGFSIMPATVQLDSKTFLTALRRHEDPKRWIDLYRSRDGAQTWQYEGIAVPDTGTGNPATLTLLKDGRLCLTYGYRRAPFGMRARLSKDQGQTWEQELILRDDGGGTDVGYPRSVERPDGKMVTIYYFHNEPLSDRYIVATIWDPGKE